MKQFAAVVVLALTSSVSSAETGLTGGVRNEFVEKAFNVCLQRQQSRAPNDPKVAKLAQYCVCYSNHLADRVSAEDNKAFDELFEKDKVELASRLRTVLDGLAEGCASALAR